MVRASSSRYTASKTLDRRFDRNLFRPYTTRRILRGGNYFYKFHEAQKWMPDQFGMIGHEPVFNFAGRVKNPRITAGV